MFVTHGLSLWDIRAITSPSVLNMGTGAIGRRTDPLRAYSFSSGAVSQGFRKPINRRCGRGGQGLMLEMDRGTRKERTFCDSTNTCTVKILDISRSFRFGQWALKVRCKLRRGCDIFNMHQPGYRCSYLFSLSISLADAKH